MEISIHGTKIMHAHVTDVVTLLIHIDLQNEVVTATSINCFKSRLDRHWDNYKYNHNAEMALGQGDNCLIRVADLSKKAFPKNLLTPIEKKFHNLIIPSVNNCRKRFQQPHNSTVPHHPLLSSPLTLAGTFDLLPSHLPT